jgi:hypothetical protein
MKKLFLISLWLFVMISLLTPSLAKADAKKWAFQPRLTTGIMHYDFEYTFTSAPGANPSKFQLIDNMPFIGGGAMLAYDRCFADTYFQVSTTGKDGGGTEEKDESVIEIDNNEFDRKDYAITFGCLVTKKLSFFTGYRNGKTDIHIASRENWLYDRFNEERIGDAKFESAGLFLGVAYSHPIGKGQLGVKLAAAKLEAEYNQHNITRTNNRAVGDGTKTSDDAQWNLSGKTLGWTLGANWTAPISKRLSYRISLDYSDYDFDTDSAYVIRDKKAEFLDILGGGVNYDMKETMYSLQLQLLYQF